MSTAPREEIAVPSDDITVMTFNIRRRLTTARRADRWKGRRDRVRALLQNELPAVLGVQEALPDQAQWVLESLGSAYRAYGRGRDAHGGGEACPVFVDTTRFEVLDWRQSALSDSPDAPGSRSWGNVIPRIAVAVDLRERRTGARIRFVNTHLDHLSARSRARSAAYVSRLATAAGVPGVVVGDFNTSADAATGAALSADGALLDAWHRARERRSDEHRTFANYRAPRSGPRIDWIFTSPQIDVQHIEILGSPVLGGWASDHLPVRAAVRIRQTGER